MTMSLRTGFVRSTKSPSMSMSCWDNASREGSLRNCPKWGALLRRHQRVASLLGHALTFPMMSSSTSGLPRSMRPMLSECPLLQMETITIE